MATFGKRAAHSIVFVICLFVILVGSHVGFEGWAVVLIAPIPGHCLPFNILLSFSDFNKRKCVLEDGKLKYYKHVSSVIIMRSMVKSLCRSCL